MNEETFFDLIFQAARRTHRGNYSVRVEAGIWESIQKDVSIKQPLPASSLPGRSRAPDKSVFPADTGKAEKIQVSPPPPTAATVVNRQKTNVAAANAVDSKTANIAENISSCRLCRLSERRIKSVPGRGVKNPLLMFVGEAPGLEEDKQGKPFVGAAGALLEKMIAAMKFTRDEVFLTYLIKCRPPYSREAKPDEVSCCINYLNAEIAAHPPRAIVIFGDLAAAALLGGENVPSMRGKWFSYRNIPCIVSYSPQYLLRHEEAKRQTWQDLKMVMQAFGRQ